MKLILSYLANNLQSFLFPLIEEKLEKDSLLEKHYQVVRILELIQIEHYLPSPSLASKGRPCKYRSKVARSFVAKHILNLKTTTELIYHLKIDKNLRRICGWMPNEHIPSESTFSRIFKLIAESNILEEIHQNLTQETFQDRIILHNNRDSVPIPAREWPTDNRGNKMKCKKNKNKASKRYYKKESVCKKLLREDLPVEEMLKELPNKCNIGRKMNSSGKSFCWRGYKLHLDVAEGWYPLSCILTSASTHDTQAAIPLSKMSSGKAEIFYELMDSAYDSQAIREYISKKGRIPLISPRIWNGKRGEETKRELKARKNLNWKPAESIRLGYRMASERLFSRLRDHFSGMSVWVRGYLKVKCHVMLGILCLTADEVLRRLC